MISEDKKCSSAGDCGDNKGVCFESVCHSKCSKNSQCFGAKGACHEGKCMRKDKVLPLEEKSEKLTTSIG